MSHSEIFLPPTIPVFEENMKFNFNRGQMLAIILYINGIFPKTKVYQKKFNWFATELKTNPELFQKYILYANILHLLGISQADNSRLYKIELAKLKTVKSNTFAQGAENLSRLKVKLNKAKTAKNAMDRVGMVAGGEKYFEILNLFYNIHTNGKRNDFYVKKTNLIVKMIKEMLKNNTLNEEKYTEIVKLFNLEIKDLEDKCNLVL